MDNLVVEVKDSSESKLVVQMMMELSKGEGVDLGERLGIVVLANGDIYEDRVQFKEHYLQTYNATEVTVAQLKDLVVLNRVKLNTKGTEMKEFLVFHNDEWTLRLLDSDTKENKYRVIVPDGADIYVKFLAKSSCEGAKVFYKTKENGDLDYFKDGLLIGTWWNRNDMLNTEHDSDQSEREILWYRKQPEDKQLPVTPVEQGSREHFEQIEEIAERIKSTDAFYCRKGNWYICPNDDNREDEAFLDGAWLVYQKLQGL